VLSKQKINKEKANRMLLTDHYISKSKIHGMGVFSAASIKAGTVVWEYNSVLDIKIQEQSLIGLPQHVVDRIKTHAEYFPTEKYYILGTDGDYYMNHSDDPNLIDGGEKMFAARDIAIGEEMTCDYRIVKVATFDPDTNLLPRIRLVCENELVIDRALNFIAT
jgi:SET domain-containing protein